MKEAALSESILTATDVGVAFGTQLVVHDVSFQITPGQIVVLLGPNGSGKSVLLRALLGLLPHTGTVHWRTGIRIGYIPQSLSVDRAMPLTVAEFFSTKRIRADRTRELLASVGLGDGSALMRQRLGSLSGGQFQRVMIAWTLADGPDVLVYDEPTSGIDVVGEETIYHQLERLRDTKRLTLIMVTHDVSMVMSYADQVLCVNGRLVCQGPPHEALEPGMLERLYGGNVHLYEHHHP